MCVCFGEDFHILAISKSKTGTICCKFPVFKEINCLIILEKTFHHILSFLVWGQFCSPYDSFLKTCCQLMLNVSQDAH